MNTGLVIIIVVGLFSIIVSMFLVKVLIKLKKYKKKYDPIIKIDEVVERSQKENEQIKKDIEKLRTSYQEKKAIYDKLLKQVAIFDEEIELSELGFYTPHFDFDTSYKFKEAIQKCKEKQKDMIKSKKAVYCTQQWTVDGSKSKGTTMTNRNIRLTSRAFNNECDAAISNVRWNNVVRLEERLQKAKESIDKMNASNKIFINDKYLSLKVEELQLTHEYAEKKQQEKEEQAEIRRQIREEEQLQREIEKAKKDEEKYEQLLTKAREEAEKATGEKLERLNEKIANLDKELAEAQEKNQRAKSMAEQTKLGHVYIISNIGSFGENIYKIGMTRRLEPIDRVKELGDASVPFSYDIHAMIRADDAPALENALHKKFELNRLNLVNKRKEFFDISLNKIKNEVTILFPSSEFIETAEAREYRESTAIRQQRLDEKDRKPLGDLPDEI